MYISGHAGLTLGIAALLNRGKEPMSYKRIVLVMVFALMPDILDRGLNLAIPGYPDHAMFHSVFLYAALFPLAYIFLRRVLPYLGIMAMHVVFDFVNVDPRAFAYPVFGWSEPFYGKALPELLKPVIQWWPEAMRYKYPFGHYLLFEAGGLFLIIWIVVSKILATPASKRLPEYAGFKEGEEMQVRLTGDLAD